MPKSQIQARVNKLRREIERLRRDYHVLNKPGTTDEVYTSLRKELQKLEEKYPQFRVPYSPTQRIAGKPLKKFKKISHRFRQWSLDDAFSKEDLKKWEEKNLRLLKKKHPQLSASQITYFTEPKIDGLHIVLTYQKGLLTKGATRGDGRTGEDVTQNLKTVESLPLKLNQPVDIVVEGECWLSRKELARINQERKKNREPLFANPRNAAAGSIRQLDPKIAASRKLNSFIYDLHLMSGLKQILSQEEELKVLSALGFKTNQLSQPSSNLEAVFKYCQKILKTKDRFPYEIDGVVVKISQKKYQEDLGHTGKAPRFAIAYKFPAQKTTTVIEDIQIQIGRTGALTPVAHLRPVNLDGSTVSRATLHNLDEINRLDARIGDTVVIRKAGDIIPEVIEVLKNLRSGKEKKFHMPRRCPQCNSKIGRRKIDEKKHEVAYYCLNPECFSVQKRRVIHFVSKKAFNIEGLGEKIIEQLMDERLVKDASDVFSLTVEDLKPLERFAQKKAQNIIEAIRQAKQISLSRFLFALGIRHVGEEIARLLAGYLTQAGFFKGQGGQLKVSFFRKIFSQLSAETLNSIGGAGEKISKSVQEYFKNPKNQELLKKLDRAGLTIKLPKENKKGSRLLGKTFVITGTLPELSRDEAKEKIIAQGGKVADSVSSKTDYLLLGKNPGSKLEKAQKLGIKKIGEKELRKMLG